MCFSRFWADDEVDEHTATSLLKSFEADSTQEMVPLWPSNQSKSSSYGATLFRPKPNYLKFHKHQVSPGETLAGIAVKHNANVEDIKRVNGLRNDSELILRSILNIPYVSSSSMEEEEEHPVTVTTSKNTSDSQWVKIHKKVFPFFRRSLSLL